jgi:hypothetical protein
MHDTYGAVIVGLDLPICALCRDVANFISTKTEQQCYKHYMAGECFHPCHSTVSVVAAQYLRALLVNLCYPLP